MAVRMTEAKGPLFENDQEFVKEIERNIQLHHHFPYVKLQYLVKHLKDSSEIEPQISRQSTKKNWQTKQADISSSSKNLNSSRLKSSKCHICPLRFPNQYLLGVHIKAKHKSVSQPFLCTSCPSTFVTNKQFTSHLITEHPQEFRCHKDAKKNGRISVRRKSGGDSCLSLKFFNCTQANCEYRFRNQKQLNAHLQNLHGVDPNIGKNLLACLFCDYKCKTSYDLNSHNRIHTDERPYSCTGCGITMAKNCNLSVHIRLHCPARKNKKLLLPSTPPKASVNDNIDVTQCTLPFTSTVPQLQIECEKSIGDETLICPICELDFESQGALLMHKEQVHLIYETKFSVELQNLEDLENSSKSLSTSSKEQKDGQAELSSFLKCPICQSEFKRQYMLGLHIQTQHPEVPKPFICTYCPSSFATNKEFSSHLVSEHPNEYRSYTDHKTGNITVKKRSMKWNTTTPQPEEHLTENSESISLKNSIKCPICRQDFRTHYLLGIHIQAHHKEVSHPFICTTCPSCFETYNEFKSHLIKQHPADYTFIKYNFQSGKLKMSKINPQICSDIPNSGQEKSSICLVCHQAFSNHYLLGIHIKAQHTEVSKPLMCTTCPSSFETYDEFKLHLISEHPAEYRFHKDASKSGNISVLKIKKNFKKPVSVTKPLTRKCPLCPRTYAYPSELARHTNAVHSTNRHVCQTCGSKYTTLSKLEYHQKLQRCQFVLKTQAARRLKCSQANCDINFKNTSNLNEHLRNVHGINPPEIERKPTICLFCGYDAKRPYDLVIHNRIHTGEKPYSCSACGKTAAKRYTLFQHIKLSCPGATLEMLDSTSKKSKKKTTGQTDKSNKNEYTCPYCLSEFSNWKSFIQHKKVVHSKSACSICDLDFESEKAVQIHKEKVHIVYEPKYPTPRNLTTPTMPILAAQPGHSGSPIDVETSESVPVDSVVKFYRCDKCGSKFLIGSYLRNHRLKNVCESILARCTECNKCGIFFDNKMHLKTHQRQCLTAEELDILNTFRCTANGCGKVYDNNTSLRTHRRRIHGLGTVKKACEHQDFNLEPGALQSELNQPIHIEIGNLEPCDRDPLPLSSSEDTLTFSSNPCDTFSMEEEEAFASDIFQPVLSWVGSITDNDADPLAMPSSSYINYTEVEAVIPTTVLKMEP